MIKLILILLTVFFIQITAKAQNGKPYKIMGQWLGNWKGTLDISNSNGSKQNIQMELEIKESDSARVWNWGIFYGEGENRDERNYLLRELDFQKGLFILDERNSILLDFYCKDFNAFYSTFSVNGNLISSEYVLDGNKIYFKIVSSDMKSGNMTSDFNSDSTIVNSYPVKSVHFAELVKE